MYVMGDVIHSPYINGEILMGQYETYLLCQVKPDYSDIKHMSHFLPPQ